MFKVLIYICLHVVSITVLLFANYLCGAGGFGGRVGGWGGGVVGGGGGWVKAHPGM
jgi:hypothetical protein